MRERAYFREHSQRAIVRRGMARTKKRSNVILNHLYREELEGFLGERGDGWTYTPRICSNGMKLADKIKAVVDDQCARVDGDPKADFKAQTYQVFDMSFWSFKSDKQRTEI